MKLSIFNKNLNTHLFKKIKFYNLIIKILLNQNLNTTSSFQYILLNFASNLTQLKNSLSSKYIQPFSSITSTRTTFQKNGFVPTFLPHKTFLKSNSVVNVETFQLFQLFLKLSHSILFFYSKQHFINRLLFNNLNPNDLVYTDLGKAFSRWVSTNVLLTNLFYYNIKILSFGSKLLKDEILSLNWKLSPSNLLSHASFDKSFFFSSAKTGPLYAKSFLRLSTFKIENSFIFDLNFHHRTIFFLRRYKFFSMGLVASTQNPWVVDYPIPVSISNILTQYYFIKLFLYTFSVARHLYFLNCKSLWLKLYF